MTDTKSCIRIWTRDKLPDRYAFILSRFDSPDWEAVVFVAHLPAAMLQDRMLTLLDGLPSYAENPPEMRWLGDNDYLVPSLFGANAVDFIPEPSGDGYLIVGSTV